MLVSVTNSAIIYMCNCGVKHGMRLSKMTRYLYRMILITRTTLSCVVKLNHSNIRHKIRISYNRISVVISDNSV